MQKVARKSKGFTIIEVLIVLAIAGLIMVVVFLAVPTLQRSGRNTAANANANSILTGVGNFSSNNGGTLPKVAADISFTAPNLTIGATGTNKETVKVDSSATSITISSSSPMPTKPTSGQYIIVTSATCDTNSVNPVAATNGRAFVVWYGVESGTGTDNAKCIGS